MNEQKWRSPTGHPIASHETDKLPKINDVEAKTMSDLKTVRDALEESLSNTWQDQARKVEIENILATLDRMIETPTPTEKYIDWDGLDKIRKSATGKTLDQLNAWCYANDARKAGDNAPSEKVDVEALKREVFSKSKYVMANKMLNEGNLTIAGVITETIDYLSNTGRLR